MFSSISSISTTIAVVLGNETTKSLKTKVQYIELFKDKFINNFRQNYYISQHDILDYMINDDNESIQSFYLSGNVDKKIVSAKNKLKKVKYTVSPDYSQLDECSGCILDKKSEDFIYLLLSNKALPKSNVNFYFSKSGNISGIAYDRSKILLNVNGEVKVPAKCYRNLLNSLGLQGITNLTNAYTIKMSIGNERVLESLSKNNLKLLQNEKDEIKFVTYGIKDTISVHDSYREKDEVFVRKIPAIEITKISNTKYSLGSQFLVIFEFMKNSDGSNSLKKIEVTKNFSYLPKTANNSSEEWKSIKISNFLDWIKNVDASVTDVRHMKTYDSENLGKVEGIENVSMIRVFLPEQIKSSNDFEQFVKNVTEMNVLSAVVGTYCILSLSVVVLFIILFVLAYLSRRIRNKKETPEKEIFKINNIIESDEIFPGKNEIEEDNQNTEQRKDTVIELSTNQECEEMISCQENEKNNKRKETKRKLKVYPLNKID